MPTQTLEFVASMTVCKSDICKIKKHLALAQPVVDPLRNVLITPLFAGKDPLRLVQTMAEGGKRVMFDSGGYYVQTGKVTYESLYYPLLEIYRQHRWASVYVLPDDVPTSRDSPEQVDFKVENTARTSAMFFQEMPDELKLRAMPVVHGHTTKQIDLCLETYLKMGVRQIGFGSFGTLGSKQEVNIASQGSVALAKYVIQVAHQYGIKVHIFGLGVPATVAMLKGIGADSFDSSSWLKAAGFGQVFLPFMRAYNITYNNTHSELQKGIREEEFDYFKVVTGHDCELCRSIDDLRAKKMYRAAHNLIVIAESVAMINGDNLERIQHIYHCGSPKYRSEAEKWLIN